MANIQKIREEIQNLRGKQVENFTIPHPEIDEIDILDILDRLEKYEVTDFIIGCSYNEELDAYEEETAENIDDYLDFLAETEGLTQIEHSNSYNWLGRVSNHFDYQLFSCGNGYYYVVFKVHKYGDVRANYTDEVLLQFSYETEFAEAIVECDKYIKNASHKYDIKVSALHDMLEVYDMEGNYVTEISELDELEEML